MEFGKNKPPCIEKRGSVVVQDLTEGGKLAQVSVNKMFGLDLDMGGTIEVSGTAGLETKDFSPLNSKIW